MCAPAASRRLARLVATTPVRARWLANRNRNAPTTKRPSAGVRLLRRGWDFCPSPSAAGGQPARPLDSVGQARAALRPVAYAAVTHLSASAYQSQVSKSLALAVRDGEL